MIRSPFTARRSRRGMSLAEVLVSIAIILVIGSISGAFLFRTADLAESLERRDEASRSTRVAMSVLRHQLQLAFLTSNIQAEEFYKTVFVGRDDGPDTLFFATKAHQRLYRDSRESDQAEITVWAEPMPDRTDGYVLLHRESPRIDGEPDEGGVPQPLAYNVKSLDFRYLDPTTNEWRQEWDTGGADTPNRLPRAVEISLVVYTPDSRDPTQMVERAQKTTVTLQFAQKLQQNLNSDGFNQ